MFKKVLIISILFVSIFNSPRAQSAIEVYGYVQSAYVHFHNTWDPYPPAGEGNYTYHYMGTNQLNLFLSKDLGDNFTSFVNFEYINNYSSDKGFGAFNLQEAYIKWEYRDFLKVKFGQFIPQFNAMFEMYNKTPLLPYIVRPKLYDATSGNLVDIFDILPQKALLQIFGSIPVESINFEYALFMGNPANSFISSPTNNLLPSYVAYGQSAAKHFSFGGRFGIKSNSLRAGVSIHFDKNNQDNFVKDSSGTVVNLGSFNRFRFGADIDYKFGDFELIAEYLKTSTSLPSAIQDSLNLWNSNDPYFVGNSFNQEFYYGTLLYNFSDKFFAYVMYDYLNDSVQPFYFGLDGYYGGHLGCGYYINDDIIVKFQYTKNFQRFNTGDAGGTDSNPVKKYAEDVFAFGVSVTF
jgi:hypothetical protein